MIQNKPRRTGKARENDFLTQVDGSLPSTHIFPYLTTVATDRPTILQTSVTVCPLALSSLTFLTSASTLL